MKTLNNFTKKYYLKNKFKDTMTHEQAETTIKFVLANDLLDEMVDLHVKADALK